MIKSLNSQLLAIKKVTTFPAKRYEKESNLNKIYNRFGSEDSILYVFRYCINTPIIGLKIYRLLMFSPLIEI